ncbi:hypothetical protein ACS0TY_026700 [Phlomoides rotata]
MAAGGGRSLEETPTWAVAVVCFVLISISIVIEHTIHLLGKWLVKNKKNALHEALEKVKSVGQGPISEICVSEKIVNSWNPCDRKQRKSKYKLDEDENENGHGRRLLFEYMDSGGAQRRSLAAGGHDKCAEKGKAPLVSSTAIHQLHIFIFVLAVFHVLGCIITLALGRAKMRKWKAWENETRTTEYQYTHDPERFRLARDTSFGRRHMSYWSQSPILLWVVCFLRQFVRSVPKVDYMTLRHGFIIAHFAPQSQTNFDFQKYIKRTLEEEFKVIVGISPPIWFFAVLFLMFNTHGWFSYLWLPFIPLVIILLVGTKLQVIITKMGLTFQARGEVVQGSPVVQPGDDLFWFNRPRLLLYLIHFVFFQNAFQLAMFAWAWYEFGIRSCFHQKTLDVVIRLSMGVLIQIVCSYVTLPLYALVTQMGSNMKPTIFNERVAKALRSWHHAARKQIKKNHRPVSGTPIPSRPCTPPHILSPIPLLQYYKPEFDSVNVSPTITKSKTEPYQADEEDMSLSYQVGCNEEIEEEMKTHEHSHSPPHHLAYKETAADFSFEKDSIV